MNKVGFIMIKSITICTVLFIISGAQCLASDHRFSVTSANVSGFYIPVYLYKPMGTGPFPLVVLSHGNPRNPEERRTVDKSTLKDPAIELVRQGAAVAVPIRRGYGRSDDYAEIYQMDCSRPNYYDAGIEAAKDIKATIDKITEDPDIDPKRVVLIGHSAGGFASVAAGSSAAILGVVSFAGGRGSNSPGIVTCRSQLIDAMKEYGRTSKEPELWIWSKNDKYLDLSIANDLYNAFNEGGGHAKIDIVPPYRDEGHLYVYGVDLWRDSVLQFLHKINFYR